MRRERVTRASPVRRIPSRSSPPGTPEAPPFFPRARGRTAPGSHERMASRRKHATVLALRLVDKNGRRKGRRFEVAVECPAALRFDGDLVATVATGAPKDIAPRRVTAVHDPTDLHLQTPASSMSAREMPHCCETKHSHRFRIGVSSKSIILQLRNPSPHAYQSVEPAGGGSGASACEVQPTRSRARRASFMCSGPESPRMRRPCRRRRRAAKRT